MVDALAVEGLLPRVEPGEALAHHARRLAHRLTLHRVQRVSSQACRHKKYENSVLPVFRIRIRNYLVIRIRRRILLFFYQNWGKTIEDVVKSEQIHHNLLRNT